VAEELRSGGAVAVAVLVHTRALVEAITPTGYACRLLLPIRCRLGQAEKAFPSRNQKGENGFESLF